MYSDASSHQLSSPTNAQHIRYRRFSLLPTSSFKMSVKLSRVATSEYDELLLLLTEGTKKDIRNLWYSTKDLEDILVEGGFSKSKLPNRFVSKSISCSNDIHDRGWERDLYRSKYYYCIDEDNREYHCVVDQVLDLEGGGETQSYHMSYNDMIVMRS